MNDPLPPVVPYVGRFAPSPTGPLHFGSLVAALASFLDARAHQGRWLLRIEDIDPPRNQPGATDAIMQALDSHGLHWNEEVLYQSAQIAHYREIVDRLIERDMAYYCSCSRQQLKGHRVYPGNCVNRKAADPASSAVRVRVSPETLSFIDGVQGTQSRPLKEEIGDFVIYRKDQLIAYQLAVAVDDAEQKITRVVRGYDLLESTFRQIYLQKLLNLNTPDYAHIPVILGPDNEKLSKQNYAKPLDLSTSSNNLHLALQALAMNPPPELAQAQPGELLQWGVVNWDIRRLPRQSGIQWCLP